MNESVKSKVGAGATSDREEGGAFDPKFGADGLATCVTIDASRGDVLMVAHMNEAALRATLSTGIVHYWSRSRGALWRKGDTSGQTQTLVEMRVDCDQDAFLAFVTVGGRRRLSYRPTIVLLSTCRDGRRNAPADSHRSAEREPLMLSRSGGLPSPRASGPHSR